MPDFLVHLILIISGAIILLAGVLVGGFLIFRGRAMTGDSFIPQSPKGEAFTIPEGLGSPDFPGEEEPNENEKKVLKKTTEFLSRFNKEAS